MMNDMNTGNVTMFVLLSIAVAATACKDSAPKLSTVCRESIDRSRSMLSVPDFVSARDWAAQAGKQCGAEQQAEVDALRRDIDAAENKQKEAEARKRAELQPKPVSESVVPDFVEAVKTYRDEKGREKCDEPICEGNRSAGSVSANVTTAKGKVKAFSAFATFTKELVTCGQLGAHERKRAWTDKPHEKEHCVLQDGPLKGMAMLVSRQANPPESDVTLFTEEWLDYDVNLKDSLSRPGSP